MAPTADGAGIAVFWSVAGRGALPDLLYSVGSVRMPIAARLVYHHLRPAAYDNATDSAPSLLRCTTFARVTNRCIERLASSRAELERGSVNVVNIGHDERSLAAELASLDTLSTLLRRTGQRFDLVHRAEVARANSFRFVAHAHLARIGVRLALWLDADTCVETDHLGRLFDWRGLPATTAVLAAPRERRVLPIEFNVRHPTVRARNMSRGFNAGVFVMNVSRMAELNLIDEMIELARAQAPSSPPARAHRSWPHPPAARAGQARRKERLGRPMDLPRHEPAAVRACCDPSHCAYLARMELQIVHLRPPAIVEPAPSRVAHQQVLEVRRLRPAAARARPSDQQKGVVRGRRRERHVPAALSHLPQGVSVGHAPPRTAMRAKHRPAACERDRASVSVHSMPLSHGIVSDTYRSIHQRAPQRGACRLLYTAV